MSYLRPTCSDAAARVTNLNISRYMPSFRQGDTQPDHHVNTGARAIYEDLERLQRLPSQRPLDRRWDESRGLVFAERSHLLKNHTWTPRRGIVFAGRLDQRRNYATRPSRNGPTGVSKPADQVFGSGGLPSLEKPPTPASTTAPKGAKQEQMEREIRDKEAKIAELKQDMSRQLSAREAKIAELQKQKQEAEAEHRSMQRQNQELGKLMEEEKTRMYSNGRRDAQKEATEKATRAAESQVQGLKAHIADLGRQLQSAQAQLPVQKEKLLKEVTRREQELINRTTEFESQIANRYDAINKFDELVKQNAKETKQAATETAQKLDEVSRELQLKEDGMLKRKTQRGDYSAYRSLYQKIHDDRYALHDKLNLLEKHFKAEIDQPGSVQELKALEKEVADVRNKLADIDGKTSATAHASRLLTTITRYRDTSIAADSMGACLYMMSVVPWRSVKAMTNAEIDELSTQMQNASNSTLREELKRKKDALFAQLSTLNAATSFAYLDREVQELRTLKTESYVNKASYMATKDLKSDLEDAATRAREKRKTQFDLSHGEWRLHRNALDKLAMLAKKQAQILEVVEEHKEHERRLDGIIDDRIAALLERIRAKRETLFESHKAARVAAKRAGPTRALATSKPSSSPLQKSGKLDALRYAEDCSLKNKLVAELRDPAATMDTQTRAEKVKQCLTTSLRVAEFQIEQVEAKLIAKPRTRSESDSNSKYKWSLKGLQRARARVKDHLANGTAPSSWANVGESEGVPDTLSKRQEDDATTKMDSTSPRGMTGEQVNLANQKLSKLKLSRLEIVQKKGPHAPEVAPLSQEINSLRRTVIEEQLKSLLASRDALLPERDAKKTEIERLTLKIEEMQESIQLQVAGLNNSKWRASTRRRRMSEGVGRTSFTPRSDSGKLHPATRHLNLTSTPSKQAAHALHMGLHFTGDLSWSTALGKHQPPGAIVQQRRSFQSMAQGQSSFGHTAALFDDAARVIHAHDSEDVAALSPGKRVVANDFSDTSTLRAAAPDDDHAKSNVQPASASLSSPTSSHPSTNNTSASPSNMAELEEESLPAYEIPVADIRNALIASRNSTASFWKYSMYKNAAGEAPTRHYCTTFEQTEAQLAKFAGEKVVGFDLEWERWKSKPGEDSAKRCVSLVQIACEDKIALLHLALFRGDSTAALLSPALRSFLENPEIIKVGVNIGGDASRLKRCFGVEMQGNIELSHLYKLVKYGDTNPAKVNRGLCALAVQVSEHLHLPLAKGEVRTSSWSKRLDNSQAEYAASDAYAGLRLFYELERRRKAMKSKPPRPAFHELGLPIMLGDGQTAPVKPRQVEELVDATEDPLEDPLDDPAVLREEPNDDSDGIFDNPKDLEALDAYIESQDALADADAAADPPLPEISYPTLPPLEDSLSSEPPYSSPESTSSLPSDPLTITKSTRKPKAQKPTATTTPPTFPSPEASLADSWVTSHTSANTSANTSTNTSTNPSAPQQVSVSRPALRAYHIWHHQGFSLETTAALLRKETPLALSTVVTYIAEVLQKEGLAFDEGRVGEVRRRLPGVVRGRYGRVYASFEEPPTRSTAHS